MHMHMHMYGFKAVHVMYGFTALKPYISVWGGGRFRTKRNDTALCYDIVQAVWASQLRYRAQGKKSQV